MRRIRNTTLWFMNKQLIQFHDSDLFKTNTWSFNSNKLLSIIHVYDHSKHSSNIESIETLSLSLYSLCISSSSTEHIHSIHSGIHHPSSLSLNNILLNSHNHCQSTIVHNDRIPSNNDIQFLISFNSLNKSQF